MRNIKAAAAPVFVIGGETVGDELLTFFDVYGDEPGCTVQGLGPAHSAIVVPVHFRGPMPVIESVRIDGVGSWKDGEPEPLAALQFDNPISSYSRNVTVQHNQQCYSVAELVTDTRPPDAVRLWPWAGSPGFMPRSSLSAHYGLVLNYQFGGGLLLENRVTAQTETAWKTKGRRGSWANHFRLFGGQIVDTTPWQTALAWTTDGTAGDAEWQSSGVTEKPAIRIKDHRLSVYGTHADVFPRKGIIISGSPDIQGEPMCNWNGLDEHLEPFIKKQKHARWFDGDSPPWFIGGNAIRKPEFSGGKVDAGGFQADWPRYLQSDWPFSF